MNIVMGQIGQMCELLEFELGVHSLFLSGLSSEMKMTMDYLKLIWIMK